MRGAGATAEEYLSAIREPDDDNIASSSTMTIMQSSNKSVLKTKSYIPINVHTRVWELVYPAIILKMVVSFCWFVCLPYHQLRLHLDAPPCFIFTWRSHFCFQGSMIFFWHRKAIRTTYKWAGCEPGTLHLLACRSSGCVSETHTPLHTHTHTL